MRFYRPSRGHLWNTAQYQIRPYQLVAVDGGRKPEIKGDDEEAEAQQGGRHNVDYGVIVAAA